MNRFINYLLKIFKNISLKWTSYVLVSLLLVFVLMVIFMVIEFFKVTKDPIEIGRLIIDYLKAVLSWPVIIFALLYIFITKFEKEIRELLKSLEEVGGEKVSAKFRRRLHKKSKKKTVQLQPDIGKLSERAIQKQKQLKPVDITRKVKELLESDYKRAIKIYESLQTDLFSKEVHEAMSYNYYMDGKYEDAISELKQHLALDPKNDKVYYRWGANLDSLGRFEEAIEKYKMAIQINPKFSEAYYNWGAALDNLEKYEEAIEKYKKAIEINPTDADAYYNWGVDLSNLDREGEAIEKFEKVLEINPEAGDVYSSLAASLIIVGRYQDAIAKCKKALELNSKDDVAYYNLGCAYSRLKQKEESVKNLRKAIELDPMNKELAKTEKDFDNIRNDPEFKKLVGE